MLLKKTGFTLIAVFTLALGIGANTAISSAVERVLLKSLPYSNPEELVAVTLTSQRLGIEDHAS
jgi:putative ABC transport system permease protein